VGQLRLQSQLLSWFSWDCSLSSYRGAVRLQPQLLSWSSETAVSAPLVEQLWLQSQQLSWNSWDCSLNSSTKTTGSNNDLFVPDAVDTFIFVSVDGCRNQPKHLERLSDKINCVYLRLVLHLSTQSCELHSHEHKISLNFFVLQLLNIPSNLVQNITYLFPTCTHHPITNTERQHFRSEMRVHRILNCTWGWI